MGVSIQDLTSSIRYAIASRLPSDGKVVVGSANRGIPFIQSDPKAPITVAINDLTKQIQNQFHPGSTKEEPVKSKPSLFGRGGR
jgi:Flp pilus assembly CpaE family ATPase